MTEPQTVKIEKPDLNEAASAAKGDDMLDLLAGELRLPRDEVLRTRGAGDLELYERLRRDDQVKSCFDQRCAAAISREWRVEPGGSRPIDIQAAEFMKEQLDAVNFDRASKKMLGGVFNGYAVAECLYRAEGGRILLAAIKVRRARRFRFDRDNQLRLVHRNAPGGELMPANKFWVFTSGGDDDDDPYGLGLGHFLYWPVFLKRNALKFWSIFLEKFAAPTPLGKAPRGSTKEQRLTLLSALRAISTDSAVVVPEGVEVELMEAARNSGGDFAKFYELLNEAIAKIILTQTMTTDDGSSKAQGQVHEDRLLDLVKEDNDLLCESFNNSVAVWLTAWNFPGAEPPKVWRDHSQPEDMEARTKRDTAIVGMGYQPTMDYIQQTYGPGWVKTTAPAQIGAAPTADTPSFAEAGAARRDAADDITDQVEVIAGPALDALIDGLGRLLDGADDLATVEKRLLEIGAGLPVDDLAQTIGDGLVVAELTGRQAVANDG